MSVGQTVVEGWYQKMSQQRPENCPILVSFLSQKAISEKNVDFGALTSLQQEAERDYARLMRLSMTRERRLPQKRDVQSVLPTQNIFSNHQTPQQSPHSSSTSSTPCQNQPQSPSVSFSTTVLLQNNTTSSSFQIPSSNHQLQYPHQPFTSPTPFQNVCQQSTTLSSSSISNIFSTYSNQHLPQEEFNQSSSSPTFSAEQDQQHSNNNPQLFLSSPPAPNTNSVLKAITKHQRKKSATVSSTTVHIS